MITNIIFFAVICFAGFIFFTRIKQVNFTEPAPLLPVILYKNDLVRFCGISLSTLNKALRNSKVSEESINCIKEVLADTISPTRISFILKGSKTQLATQIGVTKEELENYFNNPEEGLIASSLRNLLQEHEIYGGERVNTINITKTSR